MPSNEFGDLTGGFEDATQRRAVTQRAWPDAAPGEEQPLCGLLAACAEGAIAFCATHECRVSLVLERLTRAYEDRIAAGPDRAHRGFARPQVARDGFHLQIIGKKDAAKPDLGAKVGADRT